MSQDEDDLLDDAWYIVQIEKAKSMERLNYLAMNLRYDTWEKMEFTQDASVMEKIRQAWKVKRDEIKNGIRLDQDA